MPRNNRPATTGYERLAQADLDSDDSDTEPLARSTASLQPAAAPRYAPISQPRPHSGMATPKPGTAAAAAASSSSRPHRPGKRNRMRSNSGVDLKAINARLERWADEIASKFKRVGRGHKKGADEEDERLEIVHSVFQAPEGVRPVTAEALARPEPGYMTKAEFENLVDGVRMAIEQGVHPRMISQGSSGSYFARTADGKVVGVFKPKDEEPYAAGNPKWNKWIHRNLFPCCFGRACLIPNLSYVSEAAAYVLDAQLRTHLVPYTDVVWLSSKSFHYPFWDRYAHSRKRKPLPAKPGSFQVFLKGFKDANLFLREHPWPDQYLSGFRTTDPHRSRRRRWADNCRPSRKSADDGDSDNEQGSPGSLTPGPGNFMWTETLKQSFREELEKLVILDYIMRNTDRGLDNWMIKVDWETQQVSIVSEPVHLQMETAAANGELGPRPVDLTQREPTPTRASYPYRTQKPMDASTTPDEGRDPKISIGAIDNSLSWPWKHPDAWRSFPFGWLFLPVDLIGRPFSQKTRDHFLPLLTSTQWWSQTQLALRKVFQIDPDFQERMFARQIAVMKGQAWNVVETLKTADHGPLELTRRTKVCVWDDLVDVPVAVPMRATSSEMRRRAETELARAIEEEMDIGSAGNSNIGITLNGNPDAASSPPLSGTGDLIGLASPQLDLPNPGRFELTSTESPTPLSASPPLLPNGTSSVSATATATASASEVPSPPETTNTTIGVRPAMSRASLSSGPPRSLNMYSPERKREHQRRFSFTTAAGRRESNSIAAQLYGAGAGAGAIRGESSRSQQQQQQHSRHHSHHGSHHHHHAHFFGGGDDDEDAELEGDLGYAAAEGMEGNRRQVIVERLEPVKSKNPVFTWC